MPNILREEILDYLNGLQPDADPLVEEMETYAEEHDVPIASRELTHLQKLLAQAIHADHALEIGTAIGYTTIQVAETGCNVVSLEHDPGMIRQAETYIERRDPDGNIDILEGDALDLLHDLRSEDRVFDMIFIDAAKEEYRDYLDHSLPLLRSDGVVVVDNLLWYGQVATGPMDESYRESTEAIREFNPYFMNHDELHALILPLGDGTGLGVKR